VLAFFAQHDIVDRIMDGPNAINLLLRSNGRPSGLAVVRMQRRADAELAQQVLSGQWMGSRYIEVFLYSEEGLADGAVSGSAAPAALANAGVSSSAASTTGCGGALHANGSDAADAQQAAAAQQAAVAMSMLQFGHMLPWGPGAESPWGFMPPEFLGLSGGPDASQNSGQSWEALLECLGPEGAAVMGGAANGTETTGV
jgi:hypothetical protein